MVDAHDLHFAVDPAAEGDADLRALTADARIGDFAIDIRPAEGAGLAGLLAEGLEACTIENPQTLDTFNLLRRPAWAYKKLGKQV